MKPAYHILSNFCSCCVRGQCSTFEAMHSLCLVARVTVIDKEERVCHISHPETTANFAFLDSLIVL